MVRLADGDSGQVNCVSPGSIQLQREAGDLGQDLENGRRSLRSEALTDKVTYRGCLVTCWGDSVLGKFCISSCRQAMTLNLTPVSFLFHCLPAFSISIRYCS